MEIWFCSKIFFIFISTRRKSRNCRKNGAGKSTLLNIIQGLEPKDSGEIETGETIKFGYFSQKGLQYNEEERVIDFIKNISENFL